MPETAATSKLRPSPKRTTGTKQLASPNSPGPLLGTGNHESYIIPMWRYQQFPCFPPSRGRGPAGRGWPAHPGGLLPYQPTGHACRRLSGMGVCGRRRNMVAAANTTTKHDQHMLAGKLDLHIFFTHVQKHVYPHGDLWTSRCTYLHKCLYQFL